MNWVSSLRPVLCRASIVAILAVMPGRTTRADDLTITRSGNTQVQLRLRGVSNKNYSIETTPDLRTGPWLTLSTGASDASGFYGASDTISGDIAARFYRAVALAPLVTTTTTAVTLQDTPISVQLDGSDPLNPGGTLTAVITQLPVNGSLQQLDGTPITAVGTAVTDPFHRVRFIPAAGSSSTNAVFGYMMRRESDGVTSVEQAVTVSSSPKWVYSSFNDATQALLLAFSTDGLNWSTTGRDLYKPPDGNGVRDSSIVYLNGAWYIAYTAGTYFGNAEYVQICRSTDLIHWTYLCNVNTSAPDASTFSWAPEWFVNDDGTVYLYLSRPGPGGIWRLFWTQPTNAALTDWLPIQHVGGDMLTRGAIDGQVVRDGSTYYLLYRNYGNAGGTDCIEMARGTSPTSFSLYKTGDWAGWGTPREAPSLVHVNGPQWRIYYIMADGHQLNGSYIACSESNDGMSTWSAPFGVNLPSHGTCYRMPDLTVRSSAEPSRPVVQSKAVAPAR